MPARKTPTINVDVLGKPDAVPQKQVGEYIESCQQDDYFIKAPVWDTIGEGLEEFYVAARVEHHAMLREKATLMDHQETMAKTYENRINELKHAHDELRERFIKVNEFLRDFDEKRIAAAKKGTEELAIHENIKEQNAELQAVIDELSALRDRLKATAEEYEPYERVLNDVVTRMHAFNSVKDLMDRCDALMMAQVEIVELEEQKVKEMEVMRKRMAAISREAALQALGLKNALSNVDHLYEEARNEALMWERTLQRAKESVNEGIIKRDRVLEGINHMYRLLCQRRGIIPELSRIDVEQRVGFIRGEVELLRDILKAFRKRDPKTIENKTDMRC